MNFASWRLEVYLPVADTQSPTCIVNDCMMPSATCMRNQISGMRWYQDVDKDATLGLDAYRLFSQLRFSDTLNFAGNQRPNASDVNCLNLSSVMQCSQG
jgi:hypothetical protein